MALPVSGPNTGNPDQNLWAQIRQVIRDELANAARGGNGMHLDGTTGNLIIDQGDIQSGNYVPGSAGWALLPTGNAEFNSLTLRGGIIGNAALTNPVGVAQAGHTNTNYSVTGSLVALSSATLTIPAGFTTALVFASAHFFCQNTGAGSDYLLAGAQIGSVGPALIPAIVGASGWVTDAGSSSRSTSVNPAGDSITVAAMGRTNSGGTWSASASNIATIDSIALLFR